MVADLKSTVDLIFHHLDALGAPIVAKRRQGSDAHEVEAKFRSAGLTAPNGLVELYSFCDGTTTHEGERLGAIQFFPGYHWMNLDEAFSVYFSIRDDDRWKKSWFPIFANGGGDFYAVICDSNSPFFGEIVGFVLGEVDQLVEFQNVGTMFETIERSFARKVFSSSGEHLVADYPAMRAIARAVQPNFAEHEA